MEKIVNLTPHSITLLDVDNKKIEIISSGSVRVGTTTKEVGTVRNIKVIKKILTEISSEDIGKIKQALSDEDNIVVVSLLAGQRLKDDDRLSDDEKNRVFIIGNTIRDENKKIVGADALTKIKDL